ncbi:MAG: hypothetical protein U0X40_05325 [Ferruginibacter sp.]
MKKCIFLFVLVWSHGLAPAQRLEAAGRKLLEQKEDSLQQFAKKIIQGRNISDRFTADSLFTRALMRALVVRYSFQYPFDSLATVSIQYPPDSSFRIFTWQLELSDNMVRHHGVIQMNTPDGLLRRFPLIDKTVVTNNIHDTIANHMGWMGAIYYRIIQNRYNNRNYYTLLGFDANNIRSDRKIIEVLTFPNNEPVFGGPYFRFESDAPQFKHPVSRYIMEYKKDAGPRLTYDPEQDLIVFEHLISESGEPNKKWTLVGDGDYEGFKWQNGAWTHIPKIYNYVTPLGQEPVPKPIRDNGGNMMDNKLDNDNAPATDTKPEPAKKPKKGGEED